MLKNKLFQNVINGLDVGYWHLEGDVCYWSSAFITSLGYKQNEIQTDLNFFVKHLLHNKYESSFRNNYYALSNSNTDFKQTIEIKTKSGKYKEFICKSNEELPINISKENSNLIFFYEAKLKTHDHLKDDNFYYRESAEMTETGSWYVDFLKQKSYWDRQTRKILEYPEDYIPSLKHSAKYYAKNYQQHAADCFFKCAMVGTSFNTEIKMVSATKREFWVKAIGKAVYNENKDIIGIRGVFQDIDDAKKKELGLIKNSKIISSQNSRLFNFAHIVSHNLRSHSSNLSLITDLIDNVDDIDEKLELLHSIKDISESLNMTIEHLNEVVTVQTQTSLIKVETDFDKILKSVMNSIGSIITINKTKVSSDFSKVPSILYIPAYLESMLLNFITNAIKYKHPERSPEIEINSFKKEDKICLSIADNGIGIDLKKYGDKIFGMYKTFHHNKDAVGIGLFITKNQIESLNGRITVASEVNKGTTFTIEF